MRCKVTVTVTLFGKSLQRAFIVNAPDELSAVFSAGLKAASASMWTPPEHVEVVAMRREDEA